MAAILSAGIPGAAGLALAFGLPCAASAQQEVASQARGGLGDIVVTAPKPGVAELAIAITASNCKRRRKAALT